MTMHTLEKTEARNFCDNIKLSDFEQIQSYGVLLVLDNSLRIMRCSENVPSLLESNIQEILNQPVCNFLKSDNAELDITAWLQQSNAKFNRMYWQTNEKQLPISANITRYSGQILLEIECEIAKNDISQSDLIKYMLTTIQISNLQGVHEICQIAAEKIKTLTGYNRIIIYQFDEQDQSGIVVGQALDDDMDSFFGLTFPASDIPQPVRMAYMTEPMRYIPAIFSPSIKITPELNTAANSQLDLSNINLRMIAPIHAEYLHNMKLKSTSSIAIVIENKLWGLLVCHHKEPKFLSVNDRIFLLYVAKKLSLQLFAAMSAMKLNVELKAVELEAILNAYVGKEDSLTSMFEKYHHDIMQLVSATGMSLCFQNKIFNYGNTPTKEQILDLVKWLEEKDVANIYTTSILPLEFAASLDYKNIACGLLAIKMITTEQGYLLLYKPERVQTISWAGNPNETLTVKESQYSPRNTFERYQQHILNTSTPWTERQIKSAHFIQSIIAKQQLEDLVKLQIQSDKLSTVMMLAAGVAHEINNPLGYVISNMDFFAKKMAALEIMLTLFQELTDSIQLGQIEKIQKAYDEIAAFSKANNLVNKFSDIKNSVTESKEGLLEIKSIINDMKSLITKPDDKVQEIDINACVKLAIASVMDQTKSQLSIHQHYADLAIVRGNFLQMQSVFTHLFKNAIQATGDNAEISVSTAIDNNDIVITFKDNGSGIDTDDLRNLFAPFFTRKPIGTGHGLGLSLSYSIIKLHGGNITAKSKLGVGSEFIVRLPKAD